MREVVREKGRGAVCEITGSYHSLFLLGRVWRGQGKSSGGTDRVKGGRCAVHPHPQQAGPKIPS
jgi:hypothetical protein